MMNYLDFLSDTPKFYIFEKESNKTKFGGLLFILYLFLVILISVYYIVHYIKNDKYEIESLSLKNQYPAISKEIEELNDKYNPEYKLEIFFSEVIDSKQLKIVDINNEILEQNNSYIKPVILKGKINYFERFYIIYECESFYCENEKNEPYIDKEYTIWIYRDFYNNNFQNENPIESRQVGSSIKFKYNNYTVIYNQWVNVLFKENKGFWQEEHIKNYGYYYQLEKEINKPQIYPNGSTGKWYKILLEFKILNNHYERIEYKRRKISIITVFANILSYVSNLFFIFKFVYKYYSKNFDNFKIVENIYKNKLAKNKIFRMIEKDENLKFNEIKKDKLNSLEEKFSINTINEEENSEKNDDENEMNLNEESNKNFKKLCFIDFFINNIYCKCCKKSIHQEIINICNNLIYNYCSIEHILYNQILLKNLFKDYKWNNQDFNDIMNNKYLIQLENLIFH